MLMRELSAFGKLPGISDYTKVNAHFEHAVAINAEIDKLVDHLHASKEDKINSLNIQCVFEKEGRYQVVQLCASQDKIGRSYPFTIVGFMEHDLIKACQPAMPLIVSPLLQYVCDLKNDINIISKTELEAALKKVDDLRFKHTKASLLEWEIDALKSISQIQWLKDTFQNFSRENIASYVMSVGMHVLGYRSGKFPVLKILLSVSNPMVSAVFWLQWIESLLQPKRWPLYYCIVSTEKSAYLNVWMKMPEQYDFCEWTKAPDISVKAMSTGSMTALLSQDISLCDALYLWQQEVLHGIS